jgi:hypothetical protein
MLKENGNAEMAGRLWDEAQALRGKLAKQPQGDLADKIAALEKESRAMKEAGQHEMAEKLWDKAQALKGDRKKPSKDKSADRGDQIVSLENESRAMKEAGQHEMAEKLWDKAQALKSEGKGKKGKGHAGQPQGPDEKLIRTLRELQEQITDLRNEVRELKERAGR